MLSTLAWVANWWLTERERARLDRLTRALRAANAEKDAALHRVIADRSAREAAQREVDFFYLDADERADAKTYQRPMSVEAWR
jgi:hypothetical protein